jgi:hypothetical protein
VAKIVWYIAALGALLAAVAVVAGLVAARRFGPEAYQASAVAAGVNWIAGSLALAIVGASASQPWRVQGALLGMLVRMAVPLAAVVIFTQSRHPLTSHGVVILIVVHYLVGLLAETLLTVRIVAAAQRRDGGSAGLASSPQPPGIS